MKLARHGGKALADVQRPSRPVQDALKVFEGEVGGRAALVAHLAHAAEEDNGTAYLVGMIADPRNDEKSLGTICEIAGISFPRLITLFKNAGFARAQLGAFQRVWDLLPEVAGDVMTRSVVHWVTCPTCLGDKFTERVIPAREKRDRKTKEVVTVPEQRIREECGSCRGRGEVEREPDRERQKIALEIGGLVQRGAGVQVNVDSSRQVNNNLLLVGTELKNFRADSDRALYGEPRRGPAGGGEEDPLDVPYEDVPAGSAGEES